MNKKIVKDAMILTAFTLVLGLILGMVNEITKGPIAKVNYEAEQESYRNVFKDADSFEEYKDFDAKKAEDIIAKSDYAEITPIPTVEELNAHVWGEEFHACIIEQAEFEAIWESHAYNEELKGTGEIG